MEKRITINTYSLFAIYLEQCDKTVNFKRVLSFKIFLKDLGINHNAFLETKPKWLHINNSVVCVWTNGNKNKICRNFKCIEYII